MAAFLLVHGSWHGSWCWSELTALLENRGHEVVAVDLPGHGPTAHLASRVTLDDYVQALAGIHWETARPIIVSHSMGVPAAAFAEHSPAAVRAIVFIAGYVPANGAAAIEVLQQYPPHVVEAISVSADGFTSTISEAGARSLLYDRCPAVHADYAVAHLGPEPVQPFTVPIRTSAERFGTVRRFYIETRYDALISVGLQRQVQQHLRPERIFSVDSDHSPFFSAPQELTSLLDRIAGLL